MLYKDDPVLTISFPFQDGGQRDIQEFQDASETPTLRVRFFSESVNGSYLGFSCTFRVSIVELFAALNFTFFDAFCLDLCVVSVLYILIDIFWLRPDLINHCLKGDEIGCLHFLITRVSA